MKMDYWKDELKGLNGANVAFPVGKSVVTLFQEQVVRYRQAPAVVFEGETLSYQELDNRSNQLAYLLRKKGVQKGTLVPLCLDPSLEMMVGILGILKAGGAYVPIDPGFPQERIQYMLKDCKAGFIISDSECRAALSSEHEIELITLDAQWKEFSAYPENNPPVSVNPENLAYVIYTSGSTGRPKGVMIEHRNLLDYFYGLSQSIQIDQSKSFALASTIATDLGNTVLYGSLLSGGVLHLFSKETVSNGHLLHRYFKEHAIDCLKIVPSHWKALCTEDALLLPLKLLVFGGEALQPATVERIRLVEGSSCRVVNHYGPTETTIGKLLYQVQLNKQYDTSIPIGKPFSNTRVYILSNDMTLCPAGIPGQLYIAGAGVARGYLDNEELTRERFIPDPFNEEGLSFMYNTGDLVKSLPDGNIEFIGRVDDQVKIRGYRVELGEIERVLQTHAQVEQAVVLAREDREGNKCLVAYVAGKNSFDRAAVMRWLKEILPEYMVPLLWVALEKFPLTPNGKIDRKALPEPDYQGLQQEAYTAPRNETENILTEIWQSLLGLEKVGVKSNFFELGGHSLLAMRLVSQVRRVLKAELAIKDLFAYPSIEGLALLLQRQQEGFLLPEVVKLSRPERLPLSFGQDRLWFIDQLEGSLQYHMPAVLRMQGTLDITALELALRTILNRHEVLRTVIREEEGHGYQLIKKENDFVLDRIQSGDYHQDAAALQLEIDRRISLPFNLSEDNMLRASLISVAEQDHVLVITMHHIAADGWSVAIFINELIALYESFAAGMEPSLAPLPLQYADYALWQRGYLKDEVLSKKTNYWKEKLQGVADLELPTDYSRPAIQSSRGAAKSFTISRALVKKLQVLSQQEESTLFMSLLGAFKVLLYRYSGQDDICVGIPTAGRQQQELEGMIGFFVHTLALRSHLSPEASFTEVLKALKGTMLEAYEYQDTPFEKVVQAVVKERDLSRSPLFQVMFVLQNAPEVPDLQLEKLRINRAPYLHSTAQFDLTFVVKETPEGLQGQVEYSTDLFEGKTIERMIAHYEQLLLSVAAVPEEKIAKLSILAASEEHQLLQEFNNKEVSFPQVENIIDLFSKQASLNPEAIALVFEKEKLSYQKLEEKSNQLAHYLRKMGVKEESLVPICLGRSLEMIIGILGILKAGGAYVPVDPAYPKERISFMLEDTGSPLLISSKKYAGSLKEKGREFVLLDTQWEIISREAVSRPITYMKASNLAYVIYTSGSTGKPKGVMVEHQQLISSTQTRIFEYGNSGVVFLVPSFAFDSSVALIFWALSTGGSLLLCRNDLMQQVHKIKGMIRQSDTVLCVPSYYRFLLEEGIVDNSSLSKVIVAGEKVDEGLVLRHESSTKDVGLYNEYGPTECTVWATVGRLASTDRKVSIGSPVANTKIYIRDKEGQLVPVGVAGEICIGGAQVARGYLNRENLTKEKFVKDPFNVDPDSRMYPTGDLACWLPDGNIEFIGRIDDQVKIRGFRIELGEIESILQEHKQVKQVVVLAREDRQGQNRLIAYIIGEDSFDRRTVINWLKERLPEYMVPLLWVELEHFPLTPNGKIDKKALPEPDAGTRQLNQYIAPETATEEQLAEIWQSLLHLERVGVNDNFFALGGHSLLAMRLISQVRRELKVELAIKELFAYPSISGMAALLEVHKRKVSLPEIMKQERPEKIPLSFGQDRLWFIDQLEGSIHYHMPVVLRMHGALDMVALELSLRKIVDRHEVLRTVIREEEGQAYQFIKDEGAFALEKVQAAAYQQDAAQQNTAGLQQEIERRIKQPFNLAEDHMLRGCLLSLNEQDHMLVVTMHHIASDGWSVAIFMKELIALYESFLKGSGNPLAPLKFQYADYALWQRAYLQGDLLEEKIGYWKEKLQGLSPLALPTDYPRPAIQSKKGAEKSFSLNKELTGQLQLLSQQEGSTLFMSLLAAFKVLLYRYSGQEDICVGIPYAGRQQQELEGLMGFFVNTLALRSEIGGDASFIAVLQQLKSTMLEAYEHQDTPFEKVVEAVVKERDLSRSPLFQVMFVLQNSPEVPDLQLEGLSINSSPFKHTTSQFDFTFILRETAEGLEGKVEYSTDLYDKQSISRMIAHYEQLLSSIVAVPDEKVGKLEMLTSLEADQLLREFNDTGLAYPQDKTIIDLVEEQASRSPDAVAIVFEDETLTYQAMDEKANQLAHYLRRKGVKEEVLVPICLDRSLEMIIGILGILKAGGAYVPVDASYPKERIGFMLADTGAPLVISSSSYKTLLEEKGREHVWLDAAWDLIAKESKEKPTISLKLSDLAYVIYTSGSTGRPKGVMVEQAGVMNLIAWHIEAFKVNGASRSTSMAGVGFDAFGWEVWPYLAAGASIFLVDNENRLLPSKLVKFFNAKEITHTFLSTALVQDFVNESKGKINSLQFLLTGGDKLTPINGQGLGYKIINNYGPTENTVLSTSYELLEEDGDGVASTQWPPIGKPVYNTQIYITGRAGELVPPGVAGELWIGGVQVARGYLNNARLTQEKFIDNPFGEGKAYRTGDLGKWLPDGNIAFIGRIDEQVKIRGYRIELGEIESVLHESGMVEQAVVLAKEDSEGNKHLVSFVVGDGFFDREAAMLFLRQRLPEYMIPLQWVELEHFPLTPNGKVDKKALPEPGAGVIQKERYVTPRIETEKKLAEIWQALLHLERVGMNDNFFELGGHSLLAMRLISRIRKELKVELAIKELFAYPTIAGLAALLQAQQKEAALSGIVKQERPERIPLSFGQDRLWFIDQLEGSIHYHMPVVLRMHGALDMVALELSLRKIVDRHEVLRTVIREEDGQAYLFIKKEGAFALEKVQAAAYQQNAAQHGAAGLQQEIENRVKQPFNLAEDHMLRGCLLSLNEQDHVLVLTLHHIASDGWSVAIFIKEFIALYGSFHQGNGNPLTPLQFQYADYALWQRAYLQGDVLEEKVGYWKEKLQGLSPLALPTDYPRPAIQSKKGAEKSFRINKELTGKLQLLSQQEDCTLFMSLLAAFKVLLYRYSGQEDVCVGIPTAGRQQQELEGLIGFFVNTLALRSQFSSDASFAEVLRELKGTMLEAYEHQDAPFEKVVEAVVKERDLSRSPLFQVMFVLQNASEVSEFQLDGLSISKSSYRHTTSQFDFTFVIKETSEGLQGLVEYSTDLYDEQSISRMVAHYEQLLSSIVAAPQEKLGKLGMLTSLEEGQLLREFNDTGVAYPQDKTIIDVVEDQASRSPDAVAIVFEDETLTYRTLDEKANQLAHYLRRKGVKEEVLVPICLDRSLKMIISILGILKAGGAYVPVDASYPKERIGFILADTGAPLVISSSSYKTLLEEKGREHVWLDAEWDLIAKESKEKPAISLKPSNLAYVIYTSGSTGRPKGVMVEHRQLMASNLARISYYGNSGAVFLVPSFAFDSSVSMIFWTISTGGRLLLCRNELMQQVHNIKGLIRKSDTMLCVPSYYRFLLDEGIIADSSLSTIIVAGEKVNKALVVRHESRAKDILLYNEYGPTECTVWATVGRLKSTDNKVTIGSPIANTKIYIRDKAGELVPVGVAGEICVGGAQVGRGYLNREDLTREKFVSDPYSSDPASRIYRTGDLARWLPDGKIDFIGRIDDQVKIRGYRIELGEIESILQQHEQVVQAEVLAREDREGDKQLVGYIVGTASFDRRAVINWLKERLPEYMVPLQLVELEEMPLTQNGKVNKKALPEPDALATQQDFVAPGNETEERLAELWQNLLKIERVGVESNFFELGGHSLLAMRLISQIRKTMKVALAIKDLFAYPTIAGLAAFLQRQNTEVLAEEGFKFLVPLKAVKGKLPLYMICGTGGTAFRFQKFAHLLDPQQPVFALQQPSGINDQDTVPETIEEIARQYVEELLVHNPEGPYALSGHCVGGPIVMEMAKHLEAKGKKVVLLALFDPVVRNLPEQFKNPEGRAEKLQNTQPTWFTALKLKIEFEWFLWRHHPKDAIDYKIGKLSRKYNPFYKKNVELEAFNKVSAKYEKAIRNYQLTPYSGDAIAFFPEYYYNFADKDKEIYFKKEFHDERKNGFWENYFKTLNTHKIDGEHSNMFEPQYGGKLASVLQQHLNKSME